MDRALQENEILYKIYKSFIKNKIEEIWCCEVPVHYICIIGPNGDHHHEIGAQELELWWDAIQQGKATVRNPPTSILPQSLASACTARSPPYTSSTSSASLLGEACSLLPSNPRVYESKALKETSWLMSSVKRIFNHLSLPGELRTVLHEWENDLSNWNALWYSTPNLLRRNQLCIPFSNERASSAFQSYAWDFATRANAYLIARVQGTPDPFNINSMRTEHLQALASMIDIMVGAVGELFEIETCFHPGEDIITEIEIDEMFLSHYDIAVHIAIVAYAYKLSASFATPVEPLRLETTDIKLFRLVLHVMTNPRIHVPRRTFNVLANLAAVRQITIETLDLLARPYEVATFALCMSTGIPLLQIRNGQWHGIPGLFQALEKATRVSATKGKRDYNILYLRMYKTLHAIRDMFLQVPGLTRTVDIKVISGLFHLIEIDIIGDPEEVMGLPSSNIQLGQQ